MSNIYILEPPTSGKVLLITSVGEIEIELWSKEAPKACRNFVQLCMEGYYDGTIFHRMVPEFIVQGGDPTATGHGGESIYGKPFQDELHSRLRFVRRGLVAMANAGPNDNGSQFFFTLGATPELNSKHTIFGKVGGNTIYNMIKLGEGETDRNEKPLYAHKINKTKIISNPFDDIVPRKKKTTSDVVPSKKNEMKASKNFKLLSFGEEAEEEERNVTEVVQVMSYQASDFLNLVEDVQTFRNKGKSSHDLLNDAKLSSVPAVNDLDDELQPNSDDHHNREKDYQGKDADKSGIIAENVRSKLKKVNKVHDDYDNSKRHKKRDRDEKLYIDTAADDDVDSDAVELSKSASKLDELKVESKRLKMELLSSRQKKKESAAIAATDHKTTGETKEVGKDDELSLFQAERQKYKEQSRVQMKKGSDREAETLKMLAAFQARIDSVKKMSQLVSGSDEPNSEDEVKDDEEEEDGNDLSW